jgi:predicted nucleotidyltransferase
MPSIATIDADAAIASLVAQIVEAVHPVRIILFGSHARGDARADSDIDLLVVMPDGTHRLDTAGRLYSKISGIGLDYDLVVATVGDLEMYGEKTGPIYKTALREGRIVYGS